MKLVYLPISMIFTNSKDSKLPTSKAGGTVWGGGVFLYRVGGGQRCFGNEVLK